MKSKYSVEFYGAFGSYSIARIGSKPDLNYGFFYEDSRVSFYFYAEMDIIQRDKYKIIIIQASEGPFCGPIPNIDAGHLRDVQENIEKAFLCRRFHDLSIPIQRPDDKPLAVEFSWKIGQ